MSRNGFLRSKKVYRNYVLRAEWRFQKEGWEPNGPDDWPNAGFFINAGPVMRVWPISQEVQGHFGEAGSLFGVREGNWSTKAAMPTPPRGTSASSRRGGRWTTATSKSRCCRDA